MTRTTGFPMHIIDTVVLLAFLDKDDPRFKKANDFVLDISLTEDLFVPLNRPAQV